MVKYVYDLYLHAKEITNTPYGQIESHLWDVVDAASVYINETLVKIDKEENIKPVVLGIG